MTDEAKNAHRLAMAAKNEIFFAQDALGYPEDPNGKRMFQWLAYLRNELEAFDRAYMHATWGGRKMNPAPAARKRSF